MPTKKPRLQVTVKDETREVLERVSKAGGMSMSGYVSTMLDEMLPAMRQIAAALDAAKARKVEAFDLLAETLAGAMLEGAQVGVDLHAHKRAAKEKVQAEKPSKPRKPTTKARRGSKRA